MKITVIGASGFTGNKVVRKALSEGHYVYAISRNGKFPNNNNLEVINEDINNYL